MDEHDLSIEKREPGFLASLFGAEPETVLVNKDGDVVGKIETEEPGFFGSILGEEAKQVIVDSEGEKVASFATEEPGFVASLLGESAKTALVDSSDDKLATFDQEEPGFLADLLGEKAKNVLVDEHGEKLATFDREEPGFIAGLLGAKPKRVIRVEKDRVEEINRRLAGEESEEGDQPNRPEEYCDDAELETPARDETKTSDHAEPEDCGFYAGEDGFYYDEDKVKASGGCRVVVKRDGSIERQTVHRDKSGITVLTTTFKTRRDYESFLAVQNMLEERMSQEAP